MLVFLFLSCNNSQTGQVVTTDKQEVVDKDAPYVEGNKKIVQWESEEIDLFLKRYGWNTTQTGTGLRIEILEPGEMVYSSEKDGAKEFTVGRSEEITGLHEAMQLLRPGAKARLVIPSHLAYGVAGDGDKIKGRVPIAMIIRIKEE